MTKPITGSVVALIDGSAFAHAPGSFPTPAFNLQKEIYDLVQLFTSGAGRLRVSVRRSQPGPGVFESHRSLRRGVVVSAFMLLPSMFAAAGPPPTTVQGHVSVEGVVEVLNDVLYQPFNAVRSIGTTQNNGVVTFDVPIGKRLVIQTISIRATVTSGLKVRVEGLITTPTGEAFLEMSLQSQGTFGEADFYTSTQPVTVRVDGSALTNEVSFSFTRTGASGIVNFRVSVFGYLVDLTQ